jgi:hypothetical protein
MRTGENSGGWVDAAMWEGSGGTEGGSSEEEDECVREIDLGSFREERLEREGVGGGRGVEMRASPRSCLSSSSSGNGRGGRGGLVGGESGAVRLEFVRSLCLRDFSAW